MLAVLKLFGLLVLQAIVAIAVGLWLLTTTELGAGQMIHVAEKCLSEAREEGLDYRVRWMELNRRGDTVHGALGVAGPDGKPETLTCVYVGYGPTTEFGFAREGVVTVVQWPSAAAPFLSR